MEETLIVTRKRRRSAIVALDPGPSRLQTGKHTTEGDQDALQGACESTEHPVTVEEFLRWSAASTNVQNDTRKARRFVKLSQPSSDIFESAEVEEARAAPRKRRHALPQLPASDDEYQPSEDESPKRPARKRTTYKSKKRSLATRLLHAAVLSHVDVDASHLPPDAKDRQPLKFSTVREASPPPAVLNSHKARLIDPRDNMMRPSVFHKRAVPSTKPLSKHRFRYRLTPPPLPAAITQAKNLDAQLGGIRSQVRDRGHGKDMEDTRTCTRHATRQTGSAVPSDPGKRPTQVPAPIPLLFVPLSSVQRPPIRAPPEHPPSSSNSFFIDLCSDDDEDRPHSSPLRISSSPIEETWADHTATTSTSSKPPITHAPHATKVVRPPGSLNRPKDWSDILDAGPSRNRLQPLGSLTEAGIEMTRRFVEQQKQQKLAAR